jgi:hypothetical protein
MKENYIKRSDCILYEVQFKVHTLLRHYATSRNVVGLFSDEVIGFFIWHSPSSRSMALDSSQPVTEMSTRNLPRSKGWQGHKADNLTTICESIV